MKKLKIPAREVRGFNCHPRYSTGSLEDWLLFDKETRRRKLTRGKELFPAFKKQGFVFVAHTLWTCGCADLHAPSAGRVSPK